MNVALGSDEATALTAKLTDLLAERGHRVALFGALAAGEDSSWPAVGRAVGQAVAEGACDTGIVCCWSGTGVSIAANKIAGIRAALCRDPETVALARVWNDANVLALGLASTDPSLVASILDAWFDNRATDEPLYRAMIEGVEI